MGKVAEDAGCWSWTGPRRFEGRGALFLDRDGVIVEDTGYLGDPARIEPISGAAETIAAFNRAGVPVVGVTNQSGVGRGYFGWAEFEAVQDEIARRLEAQAGARLDAVFACAHHRRGLPGFDVARHPWRKPGAGMLLEAALRLGLALEASFIVGDKASDLEAGRAAGLRGGLHVASGYGEDPVERAAARALHGGGFEVMLGADINAALPLVERLSSPDAPC